MLWADCIIALSSTYTLVTPSITKFRTWRRPTSPSFSVVCPSSRQFVRLSVCLYMYDHPSIRPSVYPSIHPSVCISLCPSIRPPVITAHASCMLWSWSTILAPCYAIINRQQPEGDMDKCPPSRASGKFMHACLQSKRLDWRLAPPLGEITEGAGVNSRESLTAVGVAFDVCLDILR